MRKVEYIRLGTRNSRGATEATLRMRAPEGIMWKTDALGGSLRDSHLLKVMSSCNPLP